MKRSAFPCAFGLLYGRKSLFTYLEEEFQQGLSCYSFVISPIRQQLCSLDWDIGQGGVPQGWKVRLDSNPKTRLGQCDAGIGGAAHEQIRNRPPSCQFVLDRVQIARTSLRVYKEQALCAEIILVKQFLFRQRVTGGQNAGDRDLGQLLIDAIRFLWAFLLKCDDHIDHFFIKQLIQMLEGYDLKHRMQRRARVRHLPQYLRQQVQFVVDVASNRKELSFIDYRCLKPFFSHSDDAQYIFSVIQKDQTFLGDLHRASGAFE